MDDLLKSLEEYKTQLRQVELALQSTEDGPDRDNLLTLKSDINQLIELTEESLPKPSSSANQHVDDEYALFMSEMAKEGAIADKTNDVESDLKSLEGMKCRAPHEHTWGDIVYHNALVSTVMPLEEKDFNNIAVKVLFTNPTHREMLPCPYLLESDCKFSEDKCRFSHGNIVPFSSLEEYVEPNYEDLTVGSFVLVKKNDKLWHRATIKRLFKDTCMVRLESNKKEEEANLCDIFPMNESADIESETDDDDDNRNHDDLINMSLMIAPSSEKIGDWEKFTKGIGSKLMEKMGYVIGTGLGRRAEGRIDPVTAVVLPPGKSLDHCMELREKAGGDKNLFSVERKLKRLQRKQEMRNQKNYERESKKVDVFNFLNETLLKTKSDSAPPSKSEHRREIKNETCRNLNVESLKIDESIREVEKDMFKIRESLSRHRDVKSQVHKQLQMKLGFKQEELNVLRAKATNIKNEQSIRSDKKKLTIF